MLRLSNAERRFGAKLKARDPTKQSCGLRFCGRRGEAQRVEAGRDRYCRLPAGSRRWGALVTESFDMNSGHPTRGAQLLTAGSLLGIDRTVERLAPSVSRS